MFCDEKQLIVRLLFWPEPNTILLNHNLQLLREYVDFVVFRVLIDLQKIVACIEHGNDGGAFVCGLCSRSVLNVTH